MNPHAIETLLADFHGTPPPRRGPTIRETVRANAKAVDARALCDRVEALEAALQGIADEARKVVQASGAATQNGDHLTMTRSLALVSQWARAVLEVE